MFVNKEQAISFSTLNKRMNRRAFFKAAKDSIVGDVRSLPGTAIESLIFTTFLNAPLTVLTDTLGSASFMNNASPSEEMVCKAVQAPGGIMDLTITGPIEEEVASRFLPGTLIAKNWRVGILSSIGFAYMHQVKGVRYENGSIQAGIDTLYPSIPHFASGLYFWKVFKDRGLLHSIVAHAANNTLAVTAALLTCPPKTST